ncbi:DUF4252 domain-containing protein [Chryseobacterium sp. Ch-15]|uniref:DUF4252 domain-containing protein n=1 Tax=Chryseobacterium muglaense TaxID=2893752 RepID=A0A9Q3YU81_9FLAO|nr:DUF4252 domain-containing protein [Chryseobacterium muglaense]MBD3904699.1 DUF4252 domain-containing protein [Chryseobacterium muglaense]MCC9035587.1 DUF4252 domain-containing protein [Chryseobacterium muglaense]MCM2555888.1 DUF4252 domain-containing protein [Chryseobacterium muglaense]
MKIFKNFVLLGCALLLMQSCIVSSKPNIEFFSKSNYDFQDAQFASFNVPLFLAKPYIKKALREEGESEAAIAMVKKVSKIKMMTVANGSETMLKDYANYLKNENYEDWATIKHDGDNVNIRVKQKGDIIKNMLITVNSKKDMVFLDVKGSFTADDISRMISIASDK